MRSTLIGSAILVALAGQAHAQRPGSPGGGFGGGFGGRPAFGGGVGEHPGAHAAGRMRERFSRANITHDGHLTLDQARAGHMPVIMRHFDQIDTAHKGFITLDDLRAYRQRVAAERRAAQREPDPAGPDPGPSRGAQSDDDGPDPQ